MCGRRGEPGKSRSDRRRRGEVRVYPRRATARGSEERSRRGKGLLRTTGDTWTPNGPGSFPAAGPGRVHSTLMGAQRRFKIRGGERRTEALLSQSGNEVSAGQSGNHLTACEHGTGVRVAQLGAQHISGEKVSQFVVLHRAREVGLDHRMEVGPDIECMKRGVEAR